MLETLYALRIIYTLKKKNRHLAEVNRNIKELHGLHNIRTSKRVIA